MRSSSVVPGGVRLLPHGNQCSITMSESMLWPEGPRMHFMTRRFDRGPRDERIHSQNALRARAPRLQRSTNACLVLLTQYERILLLLWITDAVELDEPLLVTIRCVKLVREHLTRRRIERQHCLGPCVPRRQTDGDEFSQRTMNVSRIFEIPDTCARAAVTRSANCTVLKWSADGLAGSRKVSAPIARSLVYASRSSGAILDSEIP